MKFLEENLLDHLKRKEFSDLFSSLIVRTYPKGSFVCQPSSGENLVMIIAKGRARVYLGYEEKEFNLGILSKGDIYATHTRAFVEALDDLEVLVTDAMTFRQKMLDDTEITKAMIGILGRMLKNSFSIIEGLVFKDVNSRLATLFATEARRHGSETKDGGIIIHIDLSVEQIARLVGSTRQTVSTFLNEFSREGLIKKLERGRFLICNLEALESSGNSRSI